MLSCSRLPSWAAPCPHRGTVAFRAPSQGVGCLDAWTPQWTRWLGRAVCGDSVSGTREPEAPMGTARPTSSPGFLWGWGALAGAPAFPGATVTGRAARRPRPFPAPPCVCRGPGPGPPSGLHLPQYQLSGSRPWTSRARLHLAPLPTVFSKAQLQVPGRLLPACDHHVTGCACPAWPAGPQSAGDLGD